MLGHHLTMACDLLDRARRLVVAAAAACLMAALVDLVQETAITSGGPTQDFPSGGSSVFSASEPVKAGLFWLGPATANGTALNNARICFGITDGTRHRFFSIRSRDQQATSSCVRQAGTNNLVWIYSASTTSAAAAMALSSIASNKIVGTWGTFPPAAWLINSLLFGGSDCQAYVGEVTASSSQDGTTVVDATSDPNFGFQFDLLFMFSRITAINGTSGTDAMLSVGIVTREAGGIVQGCLSFSDEDNLGAPTRVGVEIEDDMCARRHIMGTPTEGDSVEVTATSSVGFTITKRGTNGDAPTIGFLALKFNGALQGLKLFTNTSRTTTGSQSVPPSGGFPIQALVGIFSHVASLNSLDTGDNGTFGFGAATASNREFCSAYMSRDNLGTSDTKCVTSASLIDVPLATGGAGITADVTTLPTSTGADLNYSVVLGTARQQLMLAIGRNHTKAKASTVGGGEESGKGKVPHGGRTRTAAGAAPKAAPTVPASATAATGRAAAGEIGRVVATAQRKGVARSAEQADSAARGASSHKGRASASGGSAGRSTAGVAHRTRSAAAPGAAPRSASTVAHKGAAKAQAGTEDRAAGRSAHAGRAVAAPVAADRASSSSTKGGRARAVPGAAPKAAPRAVLAAPVSSRTAAGSIERAAPTAAHGARAVDQSGPAGRGTASVGHGGRARTSAGGGERAAPRLTAAGRARAEAGAEPKVAARAAHAARAGAQAGVAPKAAPTAARKGRASGAAGAADRSAPAAQHGARARSASGAAPKAAPAAIHAGTASARTAAGEVGRAAGRSAHGARARAATGAVPKASARSAHAGRASSAPGAAPKAAPTAIHAASVSSRTAAGEVGRAAGRSAHGGRARSAAGAEERAAPKASHGARARSAAGSAERTAPKKTAAGRARAEAGAEPKAPVRRVAGGRASTQGGAAERAAGRSGHAGRVVGDPPASATGQVKPKARLGARARAEASQVARAPVAPTEIIGFYERTARTVRGRLRAVAGALQIQYANLPFAVPVGVAWARAKVDFDEVEEVQYGSGIASYVVPGALQVELRAPLAEGEKAAMDLADALAESLQKRNISGVTYRAAEVRKVGRSGDDYRAALTVKFTAQDVAFGRGQPGAPAPDDFQGAEEQVRARFRTLLPDVQVAYDNLPPVVGGTWIKLSVFETEAFDVDGAMRRSAGVMQADVHSPLLEGEKAALKLADRVVEAFRLVDAGGVVFQVPFLQPARQVAESWVQPIFCPWTTDHA